MVRVLLQFVPSSFDKQTFLSKVGTEWSFAASLSRLLLVEFFDPCLHYPDDPVSGTPERVFNGNPRNPWSSEIRWNVAYLRAVRDKNCDFIVLSNEAGNVIPMFHALCWSQQVHEYSVIGALRFVDKMVYTFNSQEWDGNRGLTQLAHGGSILTMYKLNGTKVNTMGKQVDSQHAYWKFTMSSRVGANPHELGLDLVPTRNATSTTFRLITVP